MNQHLELGLDTFGDVTVDPDGRRLSEPQVIRNVVEEAVLADAVGIDFIGVGEHHRDDFAVSAPEVVLATIAGRTERIRLGSAVTVLSSDDPIRVFQRFATLDAHLPRPCRGDPRAGLVRRIVPAVRVRARPVRDALRGEARSVRATARRAAGDVERRDPLGVGGAAGVPAHRFRIVDDLGRSRWQPRTPWFVPPITDCR